MPSMAGFALGADTPEAQRFVFTPMPGPQWQVLLEPNDPTPPSAVTPTPASGGWPSFEPGVAWVNEGRYLAVVTHGSGSCPNGPHGIELVADQELEIRLGALFPDREVCSADISGYVTVVELPEGITPTKPLIGRFAEHEVTIAAVSR